MPSPRVRSSAYMEWAKTRSQSRFNLASSGVAEYPLSELPIGPEDLTSGGQSFYGYPPLQERIAGRYAIDPDRVVAAPGASGANHLAMAALLGPGDEALIEHPTYELLLSTAAHLGAALERFPRRFEHAFRVDPSEVARAITPRTRLVVLTNLHNPTSASVADDVLREVGQIACGVGAHVLVDEVYLDVAGFFEPAPSSAAHLGDEFVVTSSLTKAYGLGGLRCGWVVAAPELARAMWRLNDLFGVSAARPAESLSVVAFDHLPQMADRSRELIRANTDLFERFRAARGDLEVAPGTANGLVAFPRLVRGNVDALVDRLRRAVENTVVPGHFFGMPEHFRVSLGCPTETLAGGLERLGAALDLESRERP